MNNTLIQASNTDLVVVIEKLVQVLGFYADPETYIAIGFFPDRPCGRFINDFEELEEFGYKPGKAARAVLQDLIAQFPETENIECQPLDNS
jgi:hypothetical protein